MGLIVAGCMSDHRTTTLSSRFILPAQAARFPEGTPARAAFDLLLAIEYNDPTDAAGYFVPAWRLTSAKLAGEITYGLLSEVGAIVGVNPRVTSEVTRGRQATVGVTTGAGPALLGFRRIGGSWKLTSARWGDLTLAPHRSRRS